MMKRKMRLFSSILTIAMISGMLGINAAAVERKGEVGYGDGISSYDGYDLYSDTDGRYYVSISSVANKNSWSYQSVNVNINGTQLSVNGRIINGTYYIPTRAAANVLGASYSYDSSTKTATLTADGLKLVMSAGCYINYANERVLFSMTPNVILSDGRMYVPVSIFAKAVGMNIENDGDKLTIKGRYSPLLHATSYYKADEVFWLGRIIHAESQGEPLLGKIAVGNVVLNRVKSAYYPNTIYGVIFDRKYGVQFSPILDGAIYNTPSYESLLAAKVCLEGFDMSDGSFFFLNRALATSSWIPKNREYSFTIGNHDFYK